MSRPGRAGARGREPTGPGSRGSPSVAPSTAGQCPWLRPVLPIDAHVFRAQIAAVHRGLLCTPGAQIDPDVDGVAFQVLAGFGRRLVVRKAILEEEDRADVHRGAADIELDAGPPGGADNATPVRVGTMHGG